MPIASLEETLAFDGRAVIDRFCDHVSIQREDADQVFADVLRWLWLSALAKEDNRNGRVAPQKLIITDAMSIVDEMWHHFICWTRLYEEFCASKLGTFVHHTPTPTATRLEQRRLAKLDPVAHRARRRLQYEYICLALGRETLERWYVIYPEKYPKQRILSLRKR